MHIGRGDFYWMDQARVCVYTDIVRRQSGWVALKPDWHGTAAANRRHLDAVGRGDAQAETEPNLSLFISSGSGRFGRSICCLSAWNISSPKEPFWFFHTVLYSCYFGAIDEGPGRQRLCNMASILRLQRPLRLTGTNSAFWFAKCFPKSKLRSPTWSIRSPELNMDSLDAQSLI